MGAVGLISGSVSVREVTPPRAPQLLSVSNTDPLATLKLTPFLREEGIENVDGNDGNHGTSGVGGVDGRAGSSSANAAGVL